jgi:hypothetical protein
VHVACEERGEMCAGFRWGKPKGKLKCRWLSDVIENDGLILGWTNLSFGKESVGLLCLR